MAIQKHEPEILYVPDMAAKLGKTEAAIRQAFYRGADWLPKPFRMGSRIAWRVKDVDAFFEARSQKTDGRRSKGRRA